MSIYEAVLFDYGGVVTDGYVEAEYLQELAAKFRAPVEEFVQLLKQSRVIQRMAVGETNEAELVKLVNEELPGSRSIPIETVTAESYSPSHLVIEAISRLKERSELTICLASNIFPATREAVLGYGVADIFDQLYFSCDIGFRKPQPEYFRYILNDLGVEPERVLLIDDMVQNIEGARALGLMAYHVVNQYEMVHFVDNLE